METCSGCCHRTAIFCVDIVVSFFVTLNCRSVKIRGDWCKSIGRKKCCNVILTVNSDYTITPITSTFLFFFPDPKMMVKVSPCSTGKYILMFIIYISPTDACHFNFSSTRRFDVNVSFSNGERSDHGLNFMLATG